MRMKRNQTIDVLKLVFSFTVIGIHVTLFKDMNLFLHRTLTQGLFRISVPFFFIVSGCFYARRMHDPDASKKYYLSVLKTYAVFEAIDVLILGVTAHGNVFNILWMALTTGMNHIYWYMVSLLLTIPLCTPLWKRKKTGILLVIGTILYLTAMSGDSYSFLFADTPFSRIIAMHQSVFRWPQAGLMESVLFMTIGVCLYQKPGRLPHPEAGLLLCLVLLIAEANVTQLMGAADANCYLMMPLTAVFLFETAEKHPSCSLYRPCFRDLSLYIYMTQIYFNWMGQSLGLPSLFGFVISSVLSCILSLLIIRFRTERHKLT